MEFKWPPWTFPLLIAALGIQLIVPLSTIWNNWRVLAHGEKHFLACAPVDPTDPFRGKYLTLHFAIEDSSYAALPDWEIDQTVYGHFIHQADGSSIIDQISTSIPQGDYCKVIIADFVQRQDGYRVMIRLPISRWYVEESQAQEMEVRYREHMRNHRPLLAEVHVFNGRLVLSGLRFL
ncbi:MAG TPA: GDYXXLXY domain-containing protein [Saprospiraceae bacterium]|nr:GDYXXLXY domain-containing protein [Saprospiraceae bacterium]MCB9270771.1 GDYXXLXY domain-containing protein [Lewinellaceae bacterium]HPG05859.1 GDYXXLXY domain-containing protein [Saprospiraceae bacterium]HPQ99481.1 GDYXXLXY domain-containing protein [Saprospiraceae bacterium]HQU51415.1 GDYXXLXY domain-containing protein [Saprospiraceae bacterium]